MVNLNRFKSQEPLRNGNKVFFLSLPGDSLFLKKFSSMRREGKLAKWTDGKRAWTFYRKESHQQGKMALLECLGWRWPFKNNLVTLTILKVKVLVTDLYPTLCP